MLVPFRALRLRRESDRLSELGAKLAERVQPPSSALTLEIRKLFSIGNDAILPRFVASRKLFL
jgi:hypothetical protein